MIRVGRICTIVIIFLMGESAGLEGIYKVKLSAPVTRELTDQARDAAKENMMPSLVEWVNEHSDSPWDATNSIYRYHLQDLIDACTVKAPATSEFRDNLWIYTLTISDEVLRAAVITHNARQDSLALSYWGRTVQASTAGDYSVAFRSGVASLFHAMGHIGSPLVVPDDTIWTSVRDRARTVVQGILNRTRVGSPDMVIEGKPGYKPDKAPTLTALCDSSALFGLPINAILPYGKKVFSGFTDSQGRIGLADMRIPYVANGTFLYVRPSFNGMVEASAPFEAKDLGLSLSSSQQPTFIFKVASPRYSLRYSVNAVNQIEVPSDFADGQFLKKFLKDSCYMVPQQGSEPADLRLDITLQVSTYTNDKTYKMTLKCEAQVLLEPMRGGGSPIQRQFTAHEREYDLDKAISAYSGLFFWETAGRLTSMLKETFNGM